MDLYDVLSEFLRDKPEIKHFPTVEGKALVGYLTSFFLLNMLNKQLRRPNKTLVDAI